METIKRRVSATSLARFYRNFANALFVDDTDDDDHEQLAVTMGGLRVTTGYWKRREEFVRLFVDELPTSLEAFERHENYIVLRNASTYYRHAEEYEEMTGVGGKSRQSRYYIGRRVNRFVDGKCDGDDDEVYFSGLNDVGKDLMYAERIGRELMRLMLVCDVLTPDDLKRWIRDNGGLGAVPRRYEEFLLNERVLDTNVAYNGERLKKAVRAIISLLTDIIRRSFRYARDMRASKRDAPVVTTIASTLPLFDQLLSRRDVVQVATTATASKPALPLFERLLS